MPSKLKPGSIASEAARLSIELGIIVTPDQIRWWRKKSYPLDDVPALRHRLRNQERVSRGSVPKEPESCGNIPVEMAAEREVKLMVALADFVSTEFVGVAGADMKASLLAIGYLNYSTYYGAVIGDSDMVAKTLIPIPDEPS